MKYIYGYALFSGCLGKMGPFEDKHCFADFTRSGVLDLPVQGNSIQNSLCNNLNLIIVCTVFNARKDFVKKPCRNKTLYFNISLIINIGRARPKFKFKDNV